MQNTHAMPPLHLIDAPAAPNISFPDKKAEPVQARCTIIGRSNGRKSTVRNVSLMSTGQGDQCRPMSSSRTAINHIRDVPHAAWLRVYCLSSKNLARVLHRTLKEIGLPPMGVHALRHTFATRAVESGMDLRTLSEILGHTKVSLTLQLYAHSTMETEVEAMNCIEKHL